MGQGKRFIKGLFKDTARLDQPNGTWRYGKNLIMTNKDGSISNEGGNEISGSLGGGSLYGGQNDIVIGAVEVNDDKVVLFILGANHLTVQRSEIGIWDNGTYTILFNNDITTYPKHDLNFQTSNPIEGTFKIDPKGDLIVYWTDDLNSPRAFNVSRQERWLDSPGTPSVGWLYGINPATTPNPNHINLLDLFPNGGPIPHIELDDVITHQNSIIEGGGLRTAIYYLSLAYVDDDFVVTNYLTVSNPVSIVDEFDHTIPTTKKDGAKEGNQTTKAIKWLVTNLNTDYKYVRPAIIRSMGEATEVFKLNDIEIPTSGSKDVVFSSIEGYSPGSVADIMIDTTSYETAKTLNQLDGVLYLGNLTGTKDVGYQKYANNIKLRSHKTSIENFDEVYLTVDNIETGFGTRPVNVFDGVLQTVDPTKSYRYTPNITKWKGYMRDEVYALYIAFILNDGSMSYAYHIPGREALGAELESLDTLNTTLYGGLWPDFHKVSPSYAKRFHFIDAYSTAINNDVASPTNLYSLNTYKGMNYWENATETYPTSDDYDIWDENTFIDSLGVVQSAVGTLKNTNVRHHHFPSNKNPHRKSILEDNECEVATSDGTDFQVQTWDDTLIFSNTHNRGQGISDSYQVFQFETCPTCDQYERDTQAWLGQNNPAMALALWHGGDTFIADQSMDIIVDWNLWYEKSGSHNVDFTVELYTDATSYASSGGIINEKTQLDADNWGNTLTVPIPPFVINRCSGAWTELFLQSEHNGGQVTVHLEAGEKMYIRAKHNASVTGTKRAFQSRSYQGQNEIDCYSSSLGFFNKQEGDFDGGGGNPSTNDYHCGLNIKKPDIDNPDCRSYIRLQVKSSALQINPNDLNDAKLSHTVERLGFELEDIKIPQSIADKIQGFKIYYADRNHANRTILGQSPLLPAFKKRAQLGICKEAGNDPSAQRVLSTLQNIPEDFWSIDPYPRTFLDYKKYPNMHQSLFSNGQPEQVLDERGFKVFSFHDFYLLRSKNSLSTATHIDIQYTVRNLVFNGPALNQDKKMLSLIRTTQDTGGNDVKEIEERWGWDTETNCHSQHIKSAIFAGVEYVPVPEYTQPRLLGQKAKTYLMGDSIFKGLALGFGGKVFNEYGQSCAIFGLKDRHEIPSYWARSYRNAASGTLGVPAGFPADLGNYGYVADGAPAILVNPLTQVGGWNGDGGQRSMSHIVNLKAFKTDLYKSIDSQNLVWTGFEVTGADLDNFIFDDFGATTSTADYKTNTVNSEGIYGGDTFLCRHGISTAIKRSNPDVTSEPEKGIHYQIVESTDNINFRHSESDKSLYFPGGIAKEVLKYSGIEDFNHFDNIKYNSNYSELNTIRPAFPLPLRENKQDDFPTRTHRSAKHDTTNLIDNYRIFLALQFKDLPKNRGELWKLASFNNLLYFHMEQSLFAAKGKESMQMGDATEAFIGSGDIFSQDPDEVMQTKSGYGGTQSQWASLVTKSGYFFVDLSTRKVFLMTDQLSDISQAGMKQWFKENLVFTLEEYGLPTSCLDNPIEGMGLHSIWDPKHKRIILTKRDLKPTDLFINNFNGLDINGNQLIMGPAALKGLIRRNPNGGCSFDRYQTSKNGTYKWTPLNFSDVRYFTKDSAWTVSYYPDLQIWVSFHDYLPYKYFSTSTDFYSFTDTYPKITAINAASQGTDHGNAGIWKHNANIKGILYQDVKYDEALNYNAFEFEIIHNELAASDSLYFNFGYTIEVFKYNASDELYNLNVLEHGFTSFLLYNTFQISGDKQSSPLEYLVNTRRVGNNWKVNHFRDLAALTTDTQAYYTSVNTNIIGGVNTGTITSSSTVPMFTVAGMSEIPTPAYIDFNKDWTTQKKFIDKWIGIRLIYDNKQNNLLNLYSTNVNARPFYR